MKINFSNLLTKIKVVAEVGKIIFTDKKTSAVLNKVESGTDLAAEIKDLVRPPKSSPAASAPE